MNYHAIETWWWPFLFIAIAGWLATDIWRWMGVIIGNRLKEGSIGLIWVRATATSLVAAVIAKLIIQPTGALADFNLYLRMVAVAFGFVVFLTARKQIMIGIFVSLLILLGGNWIT